MTITNRLPRVPGSYKIRNGHYIDTAEARPPDGAALIQKYGRHDEIRFFNVEKDTSDWTFCTRILHRVKVCRSQTECRVSSCPLKK